MPQWLRLTLIFVVTCFVGVCAGLFGVGGGVLLVPLLVLLFGFEQVHEVSWVVGLLIMPGVFLGGLYGSRLAQKLSPRRMRRVFAGFLFVLGIWQIASAWMYRGN